MKLGLLGWGTLMLSLVNSALTSQGLKCHNNFENIVTCVWNISAVRLRPDVRCFLHVTVSKIRSFPKESEMTSDLAQSNILSATVVYEGIMITENSKLQQKVLCDNHMMAEIPDVVAKHSVVKLAPPRAVEVHNSTVSWRCESKYLDWETQLELRDFLGDQRTVSISGSVYQFTIPREQLHLHQEYEARVRIKGDVKAAVWSDWSHKYMWRSEVGDLLPTPSASPLQIFGLDGMSHLIGVSLATLIVIAFMTLMIFVKCTTVKWVSITRTEYIPDPSRLFKSPGVQQQDPSSWMGLLDTYPGMDTEVISLVEVVKLHEARHSHSSEKLLEPCNGDTQSSNFSNSTYFLSSCASGSGQSETGHDSYGPPGAVKAQIPTAQNDTSVPHTDENHTETLDNLRRDTQSPDSGFNGAAEDSMEELELPPSPLDPKVLPPLPLFLHAPLPSNHLFTLFNLADLHSSCYGPLKPAGDDYMPVQLIKDQS